MFKIIAIVVGRFWSLLFLGLCADPSLTLSMFKGTTRINAPAEKNLPSD